MHKSHYYLYVGETSHVIMKSIHQQSYSTNIWIKVVGNNLFEFVELPGRSSGQTHLVFLEKFISDAIALNTT